MKKTLFVLAICASSSLGTAQFFEARSTGMGGTGVAASRYLIGPLANPALLARHNEDDTVGLLLPSAGIVASDAFDLIDDVEDFQDAVDSAQNSIITNGNLTAQERSDLTGRLLALDNRMLTSAAGANIVVAVPLEGFSFAFVARSYGDTRATINVDPTDANRILTATSPSDLDNLQSSGTALSTLVSDFGISMATSLDFEALTLHLGVTPKYQRVDTFNYVVDVNTFDNSDFRDSRFRNDDSSFNADVGAAIDFPFGLTVGAMVRDLFRESYRTETIASQTAEYHVNPVGTLGASWTNDLFTVAAEIDVNETERFDLGDESRYVRVGAELNAWDWGQLRLGGQFDTEDTIEDVYTLGLGFAPFDVFHLDVAGILGKDDTYGAVLQTSFTF